MAYTACLSGIADDATSPIRVVLSIRSDFLDRVPEDERFMSELSQGLYFLTAPNREGLRGRAGAAGGDGGYRFESPTMVDNMLEHLDATQGALPLLQFAATQLWELRVPRSGCSPRAPTSPSEASPVRWPATPTACSPA
jgi:hypothetical protein